MNFFCQNLNFEEKSFLLEFFFFLSIQISRKTFRFFFKQEPMWKDLQKRFKVVSSFHESKCQTILIWVKKFFKWMTFDNWLVISENERNSLKIKLFLYKKFVLRDLSFFERRGTFAIQSRMNKKKWRFLFSHKDLKRLLPTKR